MHILSAPTAPRFLALALTLALFGCDDGDASSADPGDSGVSADSAPMDAAAPMIRLYEGKWFVNVSLVEFGLVFGFEVELTPGDGQYDSVTIAAIKGDMVSEVMATATEVAADTDGLFVVDFGVMILPGAFSPTGSDVEMALVLTVTGADEEAFCGDVTGDVIEFETPVTMSTFAAVPRGTEGPMAASACNARSGFEPIAQCPDLVVGNNSGFVSGGIERNFRIIMPDGYTPAETWPIIFAYHGRNGGEPPWAGVDDFIMATALPAATQAAGAILVLPASQGIGSEWESGSFESTRDLAFFDDMVTCIQAAYSVDSDRVHIAGHSAGAFHAALLSLSRPDVIASAAIVSGGFLTEYVAPSRTMPYLILWGGEEDFSFNQDFDVLAHASVAALTGGGHHVVRCDHSELPLEGDDSRHAWPDLASNWVTDFLLAHPVGVDPLPYADGTFPEGWPSSCAVGTFE